MPKCSLWTVEGSTRILLHYDHLESSLCQDSAVGYYILVQYTTNAILSTLQHKSIPVRILNSFNTNNDNPKPKTRPYTQPSHPPYPSHTTHAYHTQRCLLDRVKGCERVDVSKKWNWDPPSPSSLDASLPPPIEVGVFRFWATGTEFDLLERFSAVSMEIWVIE